MATNFGKAARLWAAAAVLACLPAGAFAQEKPTEKPAAASDEQDVRETAINQIAEAVAIDSACRSLKVDLNIMTVIVQRAGLDMDEVLTEAGARSGSYLDDFATGGEDAVCRLGVLLYGPQGSNAMNFLVRE